MVHELLFNKAGENMDHDLAGLVDCRSRVNKIVRIGRLHLQNGRFAGSIGSNFTYV